MDTETTTETANPEPSLCLRMRVFVAEVGGLTVRVTCGAVRALAQVSLDDLGRFLASRGVVADTLSAEVVETLSAGLAAEGLPLPPPDDLGAVWLDERRAVTFVGSLGGPRAFLASEFVARIFRATGAWVVAYLGGMKPASTSVAKPGSRLGKRHGERCVATTPEEIERLVALYRAGHSIHEIVRETGVGKHTVRDRIVEAGVEIRLGACAKKGPVGPRPRAPSRGGKPKTPVVG